MKMSSGEVRNLSSWIVGYKVVIEKKMKKESKIRLEYIYYNIHQVIEKQN